jgi:DNA-binding FrmR family transcriptional regulator
MSHTIDEKKKLLTRVRRIKGQLTAIERGLEQEISCSAILQQIASCRGAIGGLMSQVLEGHIKQHVLAPGHCGSSEIGAAEDLIAVIKTYLK